MTTVLKAPVGFSGVNRHTKVAVVGAGGTGSSVAARLLKLHQSLMAVGDYGLDVTVYDPKTVTETNVIRQQFWSENDIGFPKASLLVNRFNQFGGTNWQYVNEKFNAKSMRELPDLIITTVDSAKARLEIGEHLSEKPIHQVSEKLWLDLGNGSNGGNAYIGTQFAQSGSGDAPSPYQLFKEDWEQIDDSKISEPSCSAREALFKQNLGVNDAIASMALFRILAPLMLKGEVEISGFFLDSVGGEMTIPFGANSWAIYGYVDSKVDTAA